jgi:hypothetical protein
MCDDCRKLKEELSDYANLYKELRKKWDSPELTYSRSIELTYRKFGGPCGSFTIGLPSGNYPNTFIQIPPHTWGT